MKKAPEVGASGAGQFSCERKNTMLCNKNGEIIPISKICLLQSVDPRLSMVILMAFRQYFDDHDEHNWRVTSGLRTIREQTRLVKEGKSWTMNSYHLKGLAVDLAAITPDWKKAVWEMEPYRIMNGYVQRAAKWAGLCVSWGGDWTQRDGVHWQLEFVQTKAPKRDDRSSHLSNDPQYG